MSDLYQAQTSGARQWWRKLTGFDQPSQADTGARARLRRATADNALSEDATIDLLRRLRKARLEAGLPTYDELDLRLAVRLALVLSHVRSDSTTRFGRAIGRRTYSEADSAVLKPIRFRKLLEAETEDEIVTGVRRALQMIGGDVNVTDLARHLVYFGNDAQKRRLILDYYDARDETPAVDSTEKPQA